MVDPETFSSITRTFLRIRGEQAEERIRFRRKMEELTKQIEYSKE